MFDEITVNFTKEGSVIKFSYLAYMWKADTTFTSSIYEMCNENQYYQAIIDMGEDALPHIFQRLEWGPDFWFVALREITGANPVKPENKGNMVKMTEDWLEWRKDNGY